MNNETRDEFKKMEAKKEATIQTLIKRNIDLTKSLEKAETCLKRIESGERGEWSIRLTY